MFGRLTEGSKAVIAEARDLALERSDRFITPGHLLFGCTQATEETAGAPLRESGITTASVRSLLPRPQSSASRPSDAESLSAIGIDYEEIRSAVEATFGEGALDVAPDRRETPGGTRRPRFAPDAKKAIAMCMHVAVKELHQERLMPGHILLGLLRLDDAVVTKALEQSGTSVAHLSATVLESLAAA
jgi:ATP-dependent Clp protease ATP-binding subunit ClpA